MGSIFKLIADKALKICQDEFGCHKCEKDDAIGYKYSIEIIEDGEEVDLDYLCSDCILKNDLEPKYKENWDRALSKCNDRVQSYNDLIKTPSLPCFIQGFDWPVCCGHLAEFQGIPETHESRKDIHQRMAFWDNGFKEYNSIYDFTPESEFLEDIGIFYCHECKKEIFTFQFM